MPVSGGGGPPTITYTAGRGALVDGSVVDASSREASMLFHSVTMITPDVVALEATNGSRVEWLDSFTYFAEIGIHLTQGADGFASLGTKYGAEIRSIGSANVYGTYGAVADGADTLAYLISHNFAYIGTGTDTTNDPKLVIQTNEVVETNDGKIHYESVDHKGDFRIGNIFYINQETGAVLFDAQAITFSPTGSISLEGPTSNAYIDYSVVQVGNIRIQDNNIDSLLGPVNFLANSGSTYLNTDVYVTGNTVVSADINVDGNLFLGNQSTDTITVFSNLTQDLLPDDVGPAYGYTLGSSSVRWNTLFSNALTVANVTEITNNTISTLTTNTDLILRASTTGKVVVANTNVQIDESLTVNGTSLTVNGATSFQDIDLTGNILQTGNWNQTGNSYFTGDILTDNFEIVGSGSYITFPNFKIQNNEISITALNQDLILEGNAAGAVVFDDIVKISGTTIQVLPGLSITETGGILVTESGIPYAIEGDVNATQNLSFAPDGTGNVIIDTTNAIQIPVGNNSTRTLAAGEIRYNNVTNLYEGGGATGGLISFNGLYDSDRNTYITTGPTDNVIYFGINNVVKATINNTALNSSIFQIDNIRFTGNSVSNTVSGNNLIFAPNGTGNTVLTNVGISENNIVNLNNTALILKSTGVGYIKFVGTNGVVVPVGDNSNRRGTPEIGELRYNTQTTGVLEVFNGTDWISAVGNNATISEADVLDILDLWTLILG